MSSSKMKKAGKNVSLIISELKTEFESVVTIAVNFL